MKTILRLLFSLMVPLFLSAVALPAEENKTRAGEFIVGPPTLISLGFEWRIDGDANRNAGVAVQYRKVGEDRWRDGLPLLRLQREQMINTYGAYDYVTPNMFAGSIMDLQEDTEYEVLLQMTDPDGVENTARRQFVVRTRAEPRPYAGGRVFHVYPPGFKGKKQEPSFTGLLAAFYTQANGADWFNAYPPRVKPGDTILVHAGLYREDRYRYANQLGLLFDGTYRFRQSGTAEKPIAIVAAGDGEAIFDGAGNHVLFDVMGADYLYFEGLTIRNTEVAFQAGHKGVAGAVGLSVKNCRLENIGRGIYTDWSGSKDFYIADNTFIGKSHPERLEGWIGRVWQGTPGYPTPVLSELAVKVYGSGHVIAYNYVANFHDGIDHATYGEPDGNPDPIRERMPVSIDIYNNDITNVDDNCIEADGVMHNIRVLRNRCFNQAHRSLSTQPVLGGPVYFIRNIVYHAPEGGSVKFTANSTGILVYHNTFTSEVLSMDQASNLHYRNNLILGQGAAQEVFSVDTATNYSSSDYNGFRPNPGAEVSFIWKSPDFGKAADFTGKRVERRFRTLAEYSAATGHDVHSVLLDYDIFENVPALTTEDPGRLHDARDLDFRLRAGSKAVDAGIILPNVNDGYHGRLPDLGAYERGAPVPHYGPRKSR
ncbi:MAG: hypothetical protein QM330_11380 [Acidobacteriota bacterium]|nr:hypothetical protein [Acidobacteriota bacterium]NLT32420.1 hypothetical protein [Acidobacteriota bacterium]